MWLGGGVRPLYRRPSGQKKKKKEESGVCRKTIATGSGQVASGHTFTARMPPLTLHFFFPLHETSGSENSKNESETRRSHDADDRGGGRKNGPVSDGCPDAPFTCPHLPQRRIQTFIIRIFMLPGSQGKTNPKKDEPKTRAAHEHHTPPPPTVLPALGFAGNGLRHDRTLLKTLDSS